MFLLLACTPFVVDLGDMKNRPNGRDSQADSEGVDSIPILDDSGTTHDSEDSSTTVPDDDDAIYAAFFDPNVIQEIRLELSDNAIRQLNRDGRTWVEGNVIVNGQRFDSVGVHLKGSSTYQDFSGKPAFKIKMNEYVAGQKYGDLERITLNNMTGDVTQAKEVIIYQAWEAAGMSGPKANFAQVYVNDELFGLYTNLESMDDHWAARRYADGSGDVWDTAPDGADFTRSALSTDGNGDFLYWDLQAGTGDSTQTFYDIRDALARPTGDWQADLSPYMDTDQYLDFWAWSVVIGNQDGYPFHLNDVILYADPGDNGRFDFSPWGMDESWDSSVYWGYVAGNLSTYCMQDTVCVANLTDKMRAAVNTYETLDISAWTTAAFDLSEAAVSTDPRRPYTIQQVNQYRNDLISVQSTWPAHVRQQNGL